MGSPSLSCSMAHMQLRRSRRACPFRKGMFLGVSKMSITNSNTTTEFISDFAAAEARQRFQVSLLPVFDEIAHTFLKASHGKVHTSLQSYLDGWVSIGDAYFTRRAILLA